MPNNKILIIMDDLTTINFTKDTTLVIMLELIKQNYEIYYANAHDLMLSNNKVITQAQQVLIQNLPNDYYEFISEKDYWDLTEFKLVLMRKDPPFDLNYLTALYLLDLAEQKGANIINKPSAVMQANEKLFATHFADFCPPNLVSNKIKLIKEFLKKHTKIVLKPLDTMGGESVFIIEQNNPNLNVILEVISNNGQKPVMAQKYIADIKKGDKRVLIINGQAYPFGLARVPQNDDPRGNLAKGAKAKGFKLTKTELAIANKIAPKLKSMGIYFAGIDIIGKYLTEINVTSPTCVQEISRECNVNAAEFLVQELLKV